MIYAFGERKILKKGEYVGSYSFFIRKDIVPLGNIENRQVHNDWL